MCLLALTVCLGVAATAFAASTPRPLWQTTVDAPVADAVITKWRVFVATPAGLRAVTVKDGSHAWSVDHPGIRSVSAARRRVWAADARQLAVFDAETGAKKHEIPAPSGSVALAPHPVAGRVLAQRDGVTVIHDGQTLAELSRHGEGLFGERAAFLRQTGFWRARLDADTGRAFFVHGRQLDAVSLRDGKTLFSVATEHDLIGWPTFHDGRVFVFSKDRLLMIDPTKGEVAWTSSLPTPDPVEPLIVSRSDAEQRPWHQRAWVWAREIVGGSRDYLTLVYAHGIAFHNVDRPRPGLLTPMPDRPLPLVDDGESIFWLFRYVDEADGAAKSALMRMAKHGYQLFGRSPQPGEPTGRFVVGSKRLYVETAPGTLTVFNYNECTVAARLDFGGELATFGAADGRLIVVTRDGRVLAYPLR